MERWGEESKTPIATAIIAEKEVAANDGDIEEHLSSSPEEDESENTDLDEDIAEDEEDKAQQELSQQERSVRVASEAFAEDTTTYAG